VLVHVCRRVVFQSPRRLNLRLICTARTPVKDTLDAWPALPLLKCEVLKSGVENITSFLEHRDRICKIHVYGVTSSQLEEISAVQEPFLELIHLQLGAHYRLETMTVVPDSFLCGSAPRLRTFRLDRIRFPGSTNLLLSVTHLVDLRLYVIPPECISPEVMVIALSALTYLEIF
jgi:hypothetical protein